ncbi:uncharacterized protein BDR25DRAFT_359475 [Lindgomyces ingoldianus]|uniref:Uncharacterized protein n=1 Tax=Lindgomyces ingoldianus TaxID=673940 RepID=A0ACB6QKB7_9PLEO|nr:uncharacterized protein BDR25DRAFT_359475 [Lindgomyces ingoldianus]KAF2466581.1 hypothetical protein BDR25DRAFT_359475 [Lindgomyces ingoldianus]
MLLSEACEKLLRRICHHLEREDAPYSTYSDYPCYTQQIAVLFNFLLHIIGSGCSRSIPGMMPTIHYPGQKVLERQRLISSCRRLGSCTVSQAASLPEAYITATSLSLLTFSPKSLPPTQLYPASPKTNHNVSITVPEHVYLHLEPEPQPQPQTCAEALSVDQGTHWGPVHQCAAHIGPFTVCKGCRVAFSQRPSAANATGVTHQGARGLVCSTCANEAVARHGNGYRGCRCGDAWTCAACRSAELAVLMAYAQGLRDGKCARFARIVGGLGRAE